MDVYLIACNDQGRITLHLNIGIFFPIFGVAKNPGPYLIEPFRPRLPVALAMLKDKVARQNLIQVSRPNEFHVDIIAPI